MAQHRDIDVLVREDIIFFSWNDETIQEIALALGDPEFPEPRPCG